MGWDRRVRWSPSTFKPGDAREAETSRGQGWPSEPSRRPFSISRLDGSCRLGRLRRLYPRLCRSRRIPRCSRVLSSDRGGFEIKGFAFCWRSPEATSNPRSSKASWMQPARAASVCTRGLRCRAAMQLFCTCFRVGAVSSSLALRSRAWHAPESRESSQSSPNRATLESRLSAPSSSPRLQDA